MVGARMQAGPEAELYSYREEAVVGVVAERLGVAAAAAAVRWQPGGCRCVVQGGKRQDAEKVQEVAPLVAVEQALWQRSARR